MAVEKTGTILAIAIAAVFTGEMTGMSLSIILNNHCDASGLLQGLL